ncbi:MAG: phosphoenolpyruvate carboxylase [Oceanicaulis sp.]|uniref:phosphoenolpyruvate carboxylase n=1 Tax=Glycocaulis sp. TaxID=1969725 RepID=UPI0025C3C86A|nr:phosphoenolpyruvate carboxylase [Glycocaulis sp.]MCC5981150.1 phosphoenolpyruvate carboxylase [Oceanicaulis sp.]MCH8522472.1 phosphoenolpyruvate carboxylase [Glycocaulis sp.]
MNDNRPAELDERLPGTPAALADYCLGALEGGWGEDWDSPLKNPVGDLANTLFSGLNRGAVSVEGLSRLIDTLADEGLARRAEALNAQHGEGLSRKAESGVRAALEALAAQGFDTFEGAVSGRKGGIVFTAHPTFALARSTRAALADAAVSGKAKALKGAGHAHGPDADISLLTEHGEVLEALARARGANAALTGLALDIARQHFPDSWRTLSPDLLSLASWVGYDLDGRTDIHWSRSIAFRLQEKAIQLSRYASLLTDSGASGVDGLIERLEAASRLAASHAKLFEADMEAPGAVVKAANALTASHPARLVSLTPVVAELDTVMARADDATALKLAAIRAEMKTAGLGAAHIHLRINAAQLKSAVRADLGLEEDEDDFGRLALARASERAASAHVHQVSFASVFLEQMTARRQFMLCAQFLKHIDSDTPIRFLLAECETPATVMGAVYLARLYGVAEKVDISPLFETPDALERGGRLIERLLAEPVYRDYIAARGQLAIQLGFSDAGRFMGQAGAELAIERLHILVARALKRHQVSGVEVVVFNTHGESMGRGAHPGTLKDRLDHLLTPWARSRFAAAGVPVVHETSYQGGDGFLHFANDALARSVVFSTALHVLSPTAKGMDDPFYAEIDYTWDVYRAIKAWQEALFANTDYRNAITAFAPHMLVKSGSRKAKRPGGPGQQLDLSMLRAIPHNAALQQLGIPVNVSGGLGSSIGAEPERMAALLTRSPRMAALHAMIARARTLTSLSALRGYARLYDASEWTGRAASARAQSAARAFLDLANRLSDQSRHTALTRLANHLSADLMKLDRLVDDEAHSWRNDPDRRAVEALHAIRQALIMQAFLTVSRLPAFSRRHDLTRSDVIDLVLALRIPEAVTALDEIFPEAREELDALGAIEEPNETPDGSGGHGYPEIQSRIIRPLEQLYPLITRISVAISHYYRAIG